MYRGIIEAYRGMLPVSASTPVITLHEGNTPLIPLPKLSLQINPLLALYAKFEGLNPTGSFKDRGMTMAVSKAAEEGRTAVMCASTGNTSASAAAYAARAGMSCYVIIPDGKIALGKLSQALMHGAKVLAVQGNFDDALRLVREICATEPIALVNSVNPVRIQGQKTAAYEICEALGDIAPDYHALPVGNAGNIGAYWMGFQEWERAGNSDKLPKMLGFQAEGSAPIVNGHIVEHPDTIATAIRVGNPASWATALKAQAESCGLFAAVSDEQILTAYRMLGAAEGIFCEPASATSLAGIIKLSNAGYFTEPAVITMTLTGHGLKDPDTAVKESRTEVCQIAATRDAVLSAIRP